MKKLSDLLPRPPKTIEDLRSIAAQAAACSYRAAQFETALAQAVAITNERFGAQITKERKQLRLFETQIAGFARKHRSEYFGNRQTYTIDGHLLRFAKSPGKLSHDQSDKAALEMLLDSDDDDLLQVGIDLSPRIDKVAIKAEIEAGTDLGKRFEEIGFRVVKEESFSFTPATPDHSDPTEGES